MTFHWEYKNQNMSHHQDLINELEELNKNKVSYRFLAMYYKSKYPGEDVYGYLVRIKKFFKWVKQ